MSSDGKITYGRLLCAATGCLSALTFEQPPSVHAGHLDRAVPEDRRVDDLLRLNGWHLDHGRWVCGLHEAGPCACPALSGSCPAHPDIPVNVPVRRDLRDGSGTYPKITGEDAAVIAGVLDRWAGVLAYDMGLPKWPAGDAYVRAPFRDRLPRAAKCYPLASGNMVHVRPGCRC